MKSLSYLTIVILCVFLSSFEFCVGEDLYRILGVSKSASSAEIKRSYKKLARTWHPDKNKDPDANEKFMKINEAYETLIDDEKRRHYDNFGKTASSTGNQNHREHHEFFYPFRDFFGGSMFGDFRFTFDRDEDERYLVTFRKYTNIILPETSKKPYVLFAYSNSCLQCMKVDSVWEKFVTDLEDIEFGIGTFNFELDRALSNRVGVTSPPSIVMIINKKVKFFNDEYTQTNMREFVRRNLPDNLIKTLNDDTIGEFLQDYSGNKIRVIFSSSKPRPSLRFFSTAFAYQNRFDFGFISTSDKKSKNVKDLHKLSPGKEALLLFHEYYDSAFVSLKEQKLQGKNIENILTSNKYLILPRLSSPYIFNELCPTGTTRRSKAVCVVLFTYNIKDHEEYRRSFRNFVKEQSNEQRVKYAYVYADSQTQFTEAITRREGIENTTTKALKVALIWRNSKLDLYYSLLEDGWKLGEYNQESISALKKLVDTAVNTRDNLDFKIDQPSIIDEHQAPLLSRILNKLDDWYDLGMMKIRSMDSATWLAIFVSIFVVLGIGFMSSALSKLDKPATQTKDKERSSQSLPKEKPTVYLQTFCAQTYDKYVLRGERGLRTLIIMIDNECQNKLLQKFASIVLPYTNGDAFIFCALDLDEYLGWYRHLLEETLDFRRDLSTINKKNCVGTVLALNGSRNYYSIFHPKLPSNDFLGLDDSSDGENQTDSTININDVLNGLGSWMDRLCEGQIKRFRVQYWPLLSH